MVLFKERSSVTEWRRSIAREKELECEVWRADILWVVTELTGLKVALGVIYLATGALNVEWNAGMQDTVQRDIAELEQEGYSVSLWGDFNGHVQVGEGGAKKGLDDNGRFVVHLEEEQGFQIVNFTPKCKGVWTWARNQSRSIIDYVLTDEQLYHRTLEMVIDDTGERWTVGADHSVIQVQFRGDILRGEKPPNTTRWKIQTDTDWKPYTLEVERRLRQWMEQYKKAGQQVEWQVAYEKLLEVIVQSAEVTVGFSGGPGRKMPLTRRMRTAIRKRNKGGKKWRQACILARGDRDLKWIAYRRLSAIVDKLQRAKDLQRRRREQQRVLAEGGRNSRRLW